MCFPMTKPCLTEMKQGSKLFYSVFRPSRMYSPDEFSVYQKNKCLIFPLIQLPSLLKPYWFARDICITNIGKVLYPAHTVWHKKARALLLVIFSRHRQTPCSDKKQRPALRLYYSFCKDESFEKKNTTERKHSLSIIPLQLKFCRFY